MFWPNAISLCANTASALSVHLSVDMAAVAVNSGVLKLLGHRGVPFLTFYWTFHTVLALSAAHKSSGLSSSSSIFVTIVFPGITMPTGEGDILILIPSFGTIRDVEYQLCV